MPLAFHSLTHGTVAFGFYNIETDALLLDRLFFFCTDFCRAVSELAAGEDATTGLDGYAFEDPAAIGDLTGAIHGTRHVGYLGAVYRRWPFPRDPAGFRQRLACHRTREASEALLARHGAPNRIVLRRERGTGGVGIGPYGFDRDGFGALLAYVERGGMPTWEGYERGHRPAYVTAMVAAVGTWYPELARGGDGG